MYPHNLAHCLVNVTHCYYFFSGPGVYVKLQYEVTKINTCLKNQGTMIAVFTHSKGCPVRDELDLFSVIPWGTINSTA